MLQNMLLHRLNCHALGQAFLDAFNLELDFIDDCLEDGLLEQDRRPDVPAPSLICNDHLKAHNLV